MASKKPLLSKKGLFTCNKCGLSTSFYYFGRNWPFSKSLITLEDAYIARDPFSSDPTPLILGSHCVSCNSSVCVSPSCSVFYTKRFCVDCVQENWEEFPTEIQQEVLKLKEKDQKASCTTTHAKGNH
ncbi:hypothetical protein EMCRGX_G032417 [Ephydatia muelleri]